MHGTMSENTSTPNIAAVSFSAVNLLSVNFLIHAWLKKKPKCFFLLYVFIIIYLFI